MGILRKHPIIVTVSIAILLFFFYTTAATKLTTEDSGFGWSKKGELQNDEVLYGMTVFHKKGLAPIRISKVRVVQESDNETPLESWIFYCDRQGGQMSGGHIKRSEFESLYRGNLVPLDGMKWVKDHTFDVAVISDQNKIENTWIEITYRVWGVFKKCTISKEIVV